VEEREGALQEWLSLWRHALVGGRVW
jgi:hypothetical protein